MFAHLKKEKKKSNAEKTPYILNFVDTVFGWTVNKKMRFCQCGYLKILEKKKQFSDQKRDQANPNI